MGRPNTNVLEPLVQKNRFINKDRESCELPLFEDAKRRLPNPFWENHEDAIQAYWKTWEIAFSNLGNPEENSKFIRPFIDTAFNGNLFLWDSVFIMMFGKYGHNAFNFQQTMDNFYAHQHEDGYICREIREKDSLENFEKYDPSSTGPNLFPWTEWEYFQVHKDKGRLAEVFPVLLAYNRWYKKYRTWKDGSYWSTGWGCGMDNQPRIPQGCSREFDHGFMSWVDITLQQIFADRILIEMATVLGEEERILPEKEEMSFLKEYVLEQMWDNESAFFFDCFRDGKKSDVKSIAAFWSLLADVVPPSSKDDFIEHLRNKNEFNLPHRVPTLSKDHFDYCPTGGYWRGSIWAPTNYMVLRGLSEAGEHELAHEIGLNHNNHVKEVFKQTGTFWENYSPEELKPGDESRPDFIGWTGLSSISVLFEYVFGLRPGSDENVLVWDVRLLEKHGVKSYPLGDNLVDLLCEARKSKKEEPQIIIKSKKPVIVTIIWESGKKIVKN